MRVRLQSKLCNDLFCCELKRKGTKMTSKKSFFKPLMAVCFAALILISAGCAGVEPDSDATDANVSETKSE